MRDALSVLNNRGMTNAYGTRFTTTACQDRPVPFTEVRQTPEQAERLCGVGTEYECPLLEICKPLGYTESVYADDFVYGGISWRRGHPVSETPKPARKPPTKRYA
jgi:hypothetical protein